MYTTPTPDQDEIVACDVCFKEVPVSELKSNEASDYIHYYCGLECFAKWRAQDEKQIPGEYGGAD
jgi:hypothetical protein